MTTTTTAGQWVRICCGLLVMVILTGCQMNGKTKERSFTPLEYEHYATKPELEERLASQGLYIGDPVYIRAFKYEMQLEVWVQNRETGVYDLFRTYPICRTSGTLGPKLQEGDYQSPEGFYSVGMSQLNPNSKFYLSFNIGFPNEFDQAHDRTGTALMIHGSCVSEGCFAMTDRHIGEIYLLVEESLKYNDEPVPVHLFPFRMTEKKMVLREYSEWFPFWVNLKEGYDLFEQSRIPPKIEVRNYRYAFGSDIMPPLGHSYTNDEHAFEDQ